MTNLENYKKKKLAEFDKKFLIKSSSNCEYFRRESGLNAKEEATIIPIIKQYIENLIDEIVGCIGEKEPNANVSEYYSGSNARRQEFFNNLNKKSND